MHGLSKVMQESNIKWITVANEVVAVRKLLAEIETNDIIESAKTLCSTVGITIDYEDPVYVSREDTHLVSATANNKSIIISVLTLI